MYNFAQTLFNPPNVTSLMSSPPYPNADCDKNAGCTPFEMNIVGTTTLTHTKITYQKGSHYGFKIILKSHLKQSFYQYDLRALYTTVYLKAANRSMSCLVAPQRIFRLLMKGKFDVYLP